MKVLGVWVPPINETFFNKFYKMFTLTLQYSFLFLLTVYIVQVWGDLEAVSQPLYLLFTQACLCLKVTLFHVNVEKVRELLERMNSEVFKPQSLTHEK